MKRIRAVSAWLFLMLGAVALPACVQMPTERQSVSDLRPQISFKVVDSRAQAARVVLDGLDVGSVQEFRDGIASLRVLPGSHRLQIVSGGESIYEESFYIGDGVTRSFLVR